MKLEEDLATALADERKRREPSSSALEMPWIKRHIDRID